MKTTFRVECYYLTDKTNFCRNEILLGCFRDKWSSKNDLRKRYYRVKLEDSIKYIVFKGVENRYMQRLGDIFVPKYGKLPKTSKKSNTITKEIIL